ncbi:MAG TPA: hypothetical protein VFC60_01945 [Tissierellaceae bacterium]|nr:hypothetical protein [Tissierellaceae bacterium]
MVYYLKIIFTMLLITSICGYIFSTLKEKIYLKNNIIVIDKKAVTEEHLHSTDMKEFVLDGIRAKAGDEIKVITREKKKYNGILIGAKKMEKSIMIVTHRDEIKSFSIDNILKFKITSKYGQFFN